MTYPNGAEVETAYDIRGHKAASTDALGRQTTYAYDDMGRLTRVTFADGTKEESEYDAEGHRTKKIDRAGRATVYTYDALGRLARKHTPRRCLDRDRLRRHRPGHRRDGRARRHDPLRVRRGGPAD